MTRHLPSTHGLALPLLGLCLAVSLLSCGEEGLDPTLAYSGERSGASNGSSDPRAPAGRRALS